MPSYSRTVQLPGKKAEELYTFVSEKIEKFLSKAPIGNFEIQRKPEAHEVSIKSSMVNATLYCEDGRLRLEGSLSLMAMPFKSKLDQGIDQWIGKNFPDVKA